jgi:hypothetical protein
MKLSTQYQDQLIEELAERISSLGLRTPAIILLESNKRLGFLIGQALLLFQPFLGFLMGEEKVKLYVKLLEERDNVERLLRRLESWK